MSNKSKIEWTDSTWNPVTGCTKVSAGCKNCYAEQVAKRFWKNREFTEVLTHPERLDQPFHWKKPRRIFVNSMSDLFHESVPFEFIAEVFERMTWNFFKSCKKTDAECGCECIHDPDFFYPDGCKCWREILPHTYQILTKRPERMLEFFKSVKSVKEHKNVWLGVSCENQETADERIPLLLQIPAAIRFISAEPLLQAVDISKYAKELDWCIVGGESGFGARSFDLEWAESLRDQCKTAGVPFFMKQFGSNPFLYPYDDLKLHNRKGNDWSEWPKDLRVREFPKC